MTPLELWTDGSFNDGKGGWAFTYRSVENKWVVVYGPGGTTNNQAEFMAVLLCLQSVIQNNLAKKVTVITDSKNTAETFNTWIQNWTKVGDTWKKPDGKTAKNPEYINAILMLRPKLDFTFRWCARDTEEGNRITDRYSDMGRLESTTKFQTLE